MPESQSEPCPACGSLLDVTGANIFAERTCPVCASSINVRRNFGHYELVAAIGQGGQGIVYRAVDNTLNRQVALKLLRSEHSLDANFIQQFESEAQVTASINHPNVVRVYSFGADEGHVYLAMELVGGGTMDDLMEKLKRVPEARALQIGIEIAQGLKAGYESGLIHRDIKPGNILFAEDGKAKVVDFGLALFFEQEAEASGEIWGTPYYLSPERLNRVPEDFRSDIYSLGATLFHAIAGRPPFEAKDASHVALKHLTTQAVSLQAFAPNVSNSTAYVINRTLLKSPDDRQQSYDEFIEQLQFAREEAMARAGGGGAHKQKGRVVLDDAEGEKMKSWITIATLALLLAGLIVGGWLLKKALSGGEEEAPAPVGQVATTSIESLGEGWQAAQQSLLSGDFDKAAEAFGALAKKNAKDAPKRAWAIVLQALATQYMKGADAAASVLGQLSDGGTQVGKFFGQEIAPRLQGETGVPAAAGSNFSTTNHQALGALFLGLKDYNLGEVEDARAFIGQFTRLEPEPSVAWLAEFKNLGKPMQAEFTTYSLAVDAWRTASTPPQRTQALAALHDLLAKLPTKSKLLPAARKALADAEKTVVEAQSAGLKNNLAAGAKITTSNPSIDKDGPPEATIDGHPATKWRDDKTGIKWIAFDLGTSKEISRWIVRHTSSALADKPELNTIDFTLQSSPDGSHWADVDVVTNNHSGITDRVFPPITTRHVRLVVNKASDSPKDTSALIYEFQLGDAAEQAKTLYAPAESVAIRFSKDTPFIAGPIGNVDTAGSAQYDETKKTYTLRGSGADIWEKEDAFEFAWVPMVGDGEIIARVLSLENKDVYSKAGVMIRANLTKDSVHMMANVEADNKNQYILRKQSGANAIGASWPLAELPSWLRVVRQGSTLISSISADGVNWNETGRETFPDLGAVAYAGICVCARANGQLSKAEFSDVTINNNQP